jgi:hypothetical protein
VNAHIPTLNYGDTTDLLVGPQYESFLGFDLAALPDEEFLYVKLVLNVPGIPKEEGDILLHALDGEARWSETGVTYANRPLERRGLSSQAGGTKRIEFDISGELHANYALTGSSLHRFSSKESGQGPYIEVAYLDYEAFREAEAKYFPITFAASRAEDSGFRVSWEGTYPYGESKFKLTYGLSNLFLLSYAAEPRFVLDFASQARKDDDFTLAFAGAERSAANFALDFSAVGHGENLFEFDFVAAEFEDFALHFGVQASSQNQFGLAFSARTAGESDFVVELEAVPNENFPLSFAAQMDGTGEFLISFTPRQTSSAEVSLEFEAVSARSFGIEFAAQGHEALDITLEWEALQRYSSDLRLEW